MRDDPREWRGEMGEDRRGTEGEHDDPTGERGGRERTKKMRHVGICAAEESKRWESKILDDE